MGLQKSYNRTITYNLLLGHRNLIFKVIRGHWLWNLRFFMYCTTIYSESMFAGRHPISMEIVPLWIGILLTARNIYCIIKIFWKFVLIKAMGRHQPTSGFLLCSPDHLKIKLMALLKYDLPLQKRGVLCRHIEESCLNQLKFLNSFIVIKTVVCPFFIFIPSL